MPSDSEMLPTVRARPVLARIEIPGSKSISHRALIAAALAPGKSILDNLLLCEDTSYTINALKEMGAKISLEGKSVKLLGTGGRFPRNMARKEVFLGNSGTSYRFLLSLLALGQGEYLLTGTSRMHQRPIGELVRALQKLGVRASFPEKKGFPPVLLRAGGIQGGPVDIRGAESSQYVSSLLLSGPYMIEGLAIKILGKQVSKPYIELTIDVMEKFGVQVQRHGDSRYIILPGQRYMPRHYFIEGDISSASYFWAAAAVTGGTVTTENIRPFGTRQGDMELLDILEKMGCAIAKESNRVTVHGKSLTGIEVDMGGLPDMVPTLAAIAPFAKGKTVIRNVSHLRHKESDRLEAIASEWRRLGVRVRKMDDGVIIYGAEKELKGMQVDPHNDHRIAMSLAVLSLKVPGIVIRDKDCVIKSFPGFWELWHKLEGREGKAM